MNTLRTLAVLAAMQLSTGILFAQGGADLFKQNCGACHSIGNGKLVGPDLKDVEARHATPWLMKWIKSSQSLVAAKDKDAVKLLADNSMIPMPDQPLNDEQIKTVLAYIVEQGGAAVVADNTTSAVPISTDVVVPFNNGFDPLVSGGTPAVLAPMGVSTTPDESEATFEPEGSWWLVYLSIISIVIIVATSAAMGGAVKDGPAKS
ncbi:MAG TPA: cytochrome c [Bacteroidia bacterium]|jgi:cytochrome c551/c552|nr:cytochrome c [Bacteroidia bacterium]